MTSKNAQYSTGFWCQCNGFGSCGSKLILSNNQSRATLWVLETCLIVGLLPFDCHPNHGFTVLKHVLRGNGLRKSRIPRHIVNVKQIRTVVRGWNFGLILVRLLDVVWCNRSPCANESQVYLDWFWEEWNTSITKFQRPKAGIPSLARTCDFRKMNKIPQMLILNLPGHRQNQNLEIIPIYIVVRCFPHDNIVWIHLCDELKRSNVLNVCRMLSSISWWHEQGCLQTNRTSGLPNRAKNTHFKTMCEQTVDNSPADPFSSSNWWSSRHGVAT